MGINIEEYFQSASNALKASDLPPGKNYPVWIHGCEVVTFKADDGKEQQKLKLSFKDKEKTLILNKTNAMTIAHVHGPDTDAWMGKEIHLFSTKVSFGEQMVDAIRINMPLQIATSEDHIPGFD
jgi:hypothetical protein